jgi:hypothetical protein
VALVIFMVDEVKIKFSRKPMYMHTVWSLFALILVLWSRERRAAFGEPMVVTGEDT